MSAAGVPGANVGECNRWRGVQAAPRPKGVIAVCYFRVPGAPRVAVIVPMSVLLAILVAVPGVSRAQVDKAPPSDSLRPTSERSSAAAPAAAPPAPGSRATTPPSPKPENSSQEVKFGADAAHEGDPESEIIEEEASREAELEAMQDGLHFGPSLSLGIPHWKFALDARWGAAGFSMSYGYVSRNLGSTALTITNVEATVRVFPFHTPFYAGMGVGRQVLRAEKSRAGSATALEKVTSTYLSPHAGVQYHLTRGFFLAHEMGFVLFASSRREGALAAGAGSPRQTPNGDDVAQVREVGDRYARHWTPMVTLARLGFLL
jgi:hypothetical protein